MSSRLAYAEVRTALAAAGRARRVTPIDLGRAEAAWEDYWEATHAVELTEAVGLHAGQLAGTHAVRGANAVHLASLFAVGADATLFAAWTRCLAQDGGAAGPSAAEAVGGLACHLRAVTVTVRDARAGDARAMEQVRVDGWRAAYRELVSADLLADLVVEERVAALRRALSCPEPHEINLVAEQEGVVVAMARLCGCRDDDARVDDVAELRALYVAPGSWSNGLGGRLLDEGFARTGQPLQVLWTLEGNDRARAFYERRGFVLDGARRAREVTGSAVEVRYRRARPTAG